MEVPGLEQARIAVIGLGYVGLPLAVAFGRRYPTVGYDLRSARVAELSEGRDSTLEVTAEELAAAGRLSCTSDPAGLADCNVFVVTVPTPVTPAKVPELGPLVRASETVGGLLRPGAVVVYESTVYPGATEEVCVPILESRSGLACNRDFSVGYSPERVNPGDRRHRIETIVKVTSGSNPAAAEFVDALYASVVTAGTHRASSIRVAEAAKVIENTQRDVNIALVNELAMLFYRLGIDSEEVLKAAGTKWNFLPFRPGLVGGHCIGVDPYYLTHKAEQIGFHPAMINAGRRINDGMGAYVAARVVRLMIGKDISVRDSRVLVMGLAFKENCPDIRNTRVLDVVRELESFGVRVDVHDPWAQAEEARAEYGLELIDEPRRDSYDAIVLAVAHDRFRELGEQGLRRFGRRPSVLFDVKCVLPPGASDGRL